MFQLELTRPRFSCAKPEEPFGFQSSRSPFVLRHTMLSSPVPVKSPVPWICQEVSRIPKLS